MSYSIRDLADRFGVTLRALRFYEDKGLLSPARKTGSTSARRTYSENDVVRIAEIVRGTRFGLTLREIKQYLVDGPNGPSLEIPLDVLEQRIGALREEIETRERAIENMKILAGKAAGAISAKAGTKPPPGAQNAPLRAPLRGAGR